MIDSSIIDKIRKLRAINTERGATEDEAMAAQQRMFTLLAKYNLELSEIPDSEVTPDTNIDLDYGQRDSTVWKRILTALWPI
jgi:hypothetical protein